MNNENKEVARELFGLISAKITLLRSEMSMLEAEGNGLRAIAADIVAHIESAPHLSDAAKATDAGAVVHHKWAEVAQRYNVQAHTVATILLEKSTQMLDLVEFLKTKLRSLGFDLPEEQADPLDWDEFLFEDTAVSEI